MTTSERPTLAALRELPPIITLPMAGRFLGIDRKRAYLQNAAGTFPVVVRRRGERFYVRTVDLAEALGVDAALLLGDGAASDHARN